MELVLLKARFLHCKDRKGPGLKEYGRTKCDYPHPWFIAWNSNINLQDDCISQHNKSSLTLIPQSQDA